jgi:hypothetical protein
MGAILAFDKFEDGHARFDWGFEAAAVSSSHSRVAKKFSHIGLSKQSPTEPIEGRTPAARQRWPKASEV